jgi:hypothetical protein
VLILVLEVFVFVEDFVGLELFRNHAYFKDLEFSPSILIATSRIVSTIGIRVSSDGLFLAVAFGHQAIGCNSMLYKVLHRRICPTLRQVHVVGIIVNAICMRTEFNANLGIVGQQLNQFIQFLRCILANVGLVVVVIDVVERENLINLDFVKYKQCIERDIRNQVF